MTIKKLLYALVLPLLLFATQAIAQDKTVTGKVLDSAGAPVVNASVSPKGTRTGTQTGADGSFSIKVPSSVFSLVISSVGFASQEVGVGNGNVRVNLKSAAGSLSEVVVVAYGTRRKSDLTGSVTSISSTDFQKGNIGSAEQLLQGKVAGLQVTTGGGSAGGGSKIRIRGGASLNASNDPLIVIDGVPVEGNGIAGSANLLNTINPNDIESISVLKDASAAALYGSRATNGVLIITTKKGSKGKVKWNFNTLASIGNVIKTVKVLNGDEIRQVINDYTTKSGDDRYQKLLGNENTDWQNQIYRKAFGIDNTISGSGAVGNIPLRASVGYYNQDGILKTNNFKRLSTSLNLSPKFFDDHLSVNVQAKFSQTKNRFANEGAIGSAIQHDPTQPVYSDNKFGGYREWLQTNGLPIDLATRNPLALLDLRDNRSTVNRFIGNVQLDYKLHFLPDLHLLMNAGMDRSSGSGNDRIDSLLATDYRTGGRKQYYEEVRKNQLLDFSLFYTKDLKSINTKLDILVGHTYQEFKNNTNNFATFSYREIANPIYPELKDTLLLTQPLFASSPSQYNLEGYFARTNITIADKYLFTASLRRDASSKFLSKNRVGYFPALAAAWRVRQEFFETSTLLSELKLRMGYGITGQQDGIEYYKSQIFYNRSSSTAQYMFGSTYFSFLRPQGYDNNLKWETTATTNVGVDFGFLNNRITGSFDYYRKKTKDLLSEVPVAPGSNFANRIVTNVGNLTNEGFELVFNTIPVKSRSITWDLGFNFTYNKSTVTNLLKYQDPSFKGIDVSGIAGGTGNTIGKHLVGYAPFSYLVYKQVYDANGRPIEGLYEDFNRDGVIDSKDKYLYKKPTPDYLVGFSTQVIINKFSLGVTAHGMIGNYLYNNFNSDRSTLSAIKDQNVYIGNASKDYLETGFKNKQFFSDYYIENASFLRIDNINLGYNFGKILNNSSSLRANASIQNVGVITKYKGLDPENSSDSGVDNNIYPRPRIYSLGFSLDF